jgi:hypothetical protein
VFESRSIQGLFFIHLKKDLKTLPIDWINCDNPTVPPLEKHLEAGSSKGGLLSEYSVDFIVFVRHPAIF